MALLSFCSASVQARLVLLSTLLTLWLAPLARIAATLGLLRSRNPAPAPKTYDPDNKGEKRAWRPATQSGRYLTEEQYEQQTQIATQNALTQLFNSQEHAQWMMANHHRMAWTDAEAVQQATEED